MTFSKQITPPFVKVVNTGVDFDARMPNRWRLAWQKIIDEKLHLWLQHPELLEDDDQIPPSGSVLRIAMDIADQARDANKPPAKVTVDPNGGIVFEWREGDEAEVIHIWDDQTVDSLNFRGSQLIFRCPLSY